MLKCHHLKGNQLWEYDPVVSLLMTRDIQMRQLFFHMSLQSNLFLCGTTIWQLNWETKSGLWSFCQ